MPFHGIRRMTAVARQQGYAVNSKRVSRLLWLMGLEPVYPKPRLSVLVAGEKQYPYRLHGRRNAINCF